MTKRLVVLGAGVTGLTAAYAALRARPDAEVVVIEARDRIGGNIVTERSNGFLIDGGPDSFLRTKPDAVALCKELGLEDQLITPSEEAKKVYIVHRGQLVQMPAGMALAVPTRVGPMLTTPLIGFPSKLRMLGDFLVRPKLDDEDESIAEFVSRRFGAGAAEKVASPLLGGIYAGDVGKLSIQSTFPQLVELEQKHGSLILGLMKAQAKMRGAKEGTLPALRTWLSKPNESAPSPFYSLRGGMGSMISALAERIPRVRTGVGATRVVASGTRYQVHLSDDSVLDADAVIVAAPAHAAAEILPSAFAADLSAIPYLSTATVFLAYSRAKVTQDLDGMGFVAPRGEAKIMAGTWVSSKWEGRAPADAVLLRAFIGGARDDVDVETSTDAELVRVAQDELTRLMGALPQPLFHRVFRYHRANPQPIVGHGKRLGRLDDLLRAAPGLALAGAAYRGVGIPDCVRQGREAAERVLEQL
ncbi:MAG: protoporphyrinogen oxidase [Polyangiaceae bacterium]